MAALLPDVRCRLGSVPPDVTIRVARSADLDMWTRDALRALLDAAFEGAFTDDDWDHALGGVHAIAVDGNELVGHASVVQRRLLHDDRALRAGYVEALGVRADRRGRGIGSALMERMERVIDGAYELGALSTTDIAADFYAARGWTRWLGPTAVLTPAGVIPTPDDDGSVFVRAVSARLYVERELTCDWRRGDVW
jgi:aminoglycoside 2'-N-acetyltransferase I